MREISMKIDESLYLISNNEFSYRTKGKKESILCDFPLDEKYLIKNVRLNFLDLVEGIDFTISYTNEREINLLIDIEKDDLFTVNYTVFKYN